MTTILARIVVHGNTDKFEQHCKFGEDWKLTFAGKVKVERCRYNDRFGNLAATFLNNAQREGLALR